MSWRRNPCDAQPKNASRVMLCHIAPSQAMSHHGMSLVCHVVSCHAKTCHVKPCTAVSCHVKWCDDTCHLKSCHVLTRWSHITLLALTQSVSASASQRTRATHVNITPLNAPSLHNSHIPAEGHREPAEGHREPGVPSCASPRSCGITRSRTVLTGDIAAIVAVMKQPASIMVVSASRSSTDSHTCLEATPSLDLW